MTKNFFNEEFNDPTLLKLGIFRAYVKEWFPVFLTKSKNNKQSSRRVCVFDFFAGAGKDNVGNAGSPLIIYDELQQYCRTRSDYKSDSVVIDLFFNDIDPQKIQLLDNHLAHHCCQHRCCKVHLSNSPFGDRLMCEDVQKPLRSKDTACLVILDQFGIKYVDKDVFSFFINCPKTDIMFFTSSSYVKRFAEEKSFNMRLPINPDIIKQTNHNQIHRKLCECYKSLIPQNSNYHLSPFSVKNGSNIYGVIFGSGSLRGLEKFLDVAWKMDAETGEANFNIDEDPIRKNKNQTMLFGEMNSYKKIDEFEIEVKRMLRSKPMDNLELYSFSLEHGFLAKHITNFLKKCHNEGILMIKSFAGDNPKKGVYCIGWKYYKERNRKYIFHIKE